MKSSEFWKEKPLPIPPAEQLEKCPQCHKTLGVIRCYLNHELTAWRYASHGHFCSIGCAYLWANTAMDTDITNQLVNHLKTKKWFISLTSAWSMPQRTNCKTQYKNSSSPKIAWLLTVAKFLRIKRRSLNTSGS